MIDNGLAHLGQGQPHAKFVPDFWYLTLVPDGLLGSKASSDHFSPLFQPARLIICTVQMPASEVRYGSIPAVGAAVTQSPCAGTAPDRPRRYSRCRHATDAAAALLNRFA